MPFSFIFPITLNSSMNNSYPTQHYKCACLKNNQDVNNFLNVQEVQHMPSI